MQVKRPVQTPRCLSFSFNNLRCQLYISRSYLKRSIDGVYRVQYGFMVKYGYGFTVKYGWFSGEIRLVFG